MAENKKLNKIYDELKIDTENPEFNDFINSLVADALEFGDQPRDIVLRRDSETGEYYDPVTDSRLPDDLFVKAEGDDGVDDEFDDEEDFELEFEDDD